MGATLYVHIGPTPGRAKTQADMLINGIRRWNSDHGFGITSSPTCLCGYIQRPPKPAFASVSFSVLTDSVAKSKFSTR